VQFVIRVLTFAYFCTNSINFIHHMESTPPAPINHGNNINSHTSSATVLEEKIARLQQQLDDKNRQLGEVNKEFEAFYHAISHDLKAPLRAVTGYAGILKEDYSDKFDDEIKRLIETVDTNAKKLNGLITELLNFSRVGRNEVIFTKVKMQALVENCLNELLTKDEKHQHKISIAALPDCTGDAAMLKQVWINLIDNAIRYSAKKSERVIEIGFEEDAAATTYFISDKGTGFNMQYSDGVFNLFQRLHNDKEFEGSGMGLAFVKRIVFKHGGSVWVRSVPGEGSIFYFSIPMQII